MTDTGKGQARRHEVEAVPNKAVCAHRLTQQGISSTTSSTATSTNDPDITQIESPKPTGLERLSINMFSTAKANPYDEIVGESLLICPVGIPGLPVSAAKTTDENLTSENWELILNLCDKVTDEREQGCVRQSSSRNTHS